MAYLEKFPEGEFASLAEIRKRQTAAPGSLASLLPGGSPLASLLPTGGAAATPAAPAAPAAPVAAPLLSALP